ncbi:hypothetical protein Sjap_012248 [Stephania japonica]|uniref:Uncharacterized protein n=1 Tax=Stephania japonica TaxID=461633 RepID=A0AAP0IVN4_9MAGN
MQISWLSSFKLCHFINFHPIAQEAPGPSSRPRPVPITIVHHPQQWQQTNTTHSYGIVKRTVRERDAMLTAEREIERSRVLPAQAAEFQRGSAVQRRRGWS